MYAGFYEEGDNCPECHKAKLAWPQRECSCHIKPPCGACTDARLTCPVCGWEDNPEPYRELGGLGLLVREYAPRPLDPTKIDYRVKTHTASTQICQGVYPDGTTRNQVEAKVKGTFGGRFKAFGQGRFEYIAYTD